MIRLEYILLQHTMLFQEMLPTLIGDTQDAEDPQPVTVQFTNQPLKKRSKTKCRKLAMI